MFKELLRDYQLLCELTKIEPITNKWIKTAYIRGLTRFWQISIADNKEIRNLGYKELVEELRE